MIRPLRAETERYGHYSLAGESVYDHPFQFGSKRTGPDLARVGGRYSDEWQRAHLTNPRDVVPESNMPAYAWLANATVDERGTAGKMRALRSVGVPYTDADIDGRRGRGARQDRDGRADRLSTGPGHGLGQLVRRMNMRSWERSAASSPACCWCCSCGWWPGPGAGARAPAFDAAARMPLEDEDDTP